MNDAHYFVTFLVGVFVLLGAFALGIGAFEYEVVSLGEVERPPDGTQFVARERPEGFSDEIIVLTSYENLSARDQRIVDRAVAGERFVFRRPGRLPGRYPTKGRFAVRRDGDIYLLNRHLFFNPRTPFGVGSLVLGVVGSATVSESVRRRHFPDRPVYWLRV